MDRITCTAVVLAAGSGSRMKSSVAKQFLALEEKPLIYYALQTIEKSEIISRCILVTGQLDIEKMQQEIVEQYHFSKVKAVIPGGSERCFSVAEAMKWLEANDDDADAGERYVFIHDGARPFLTEEIIERCFKKVRECGACVAAVPSKDTVRIVDENGCVVQTPERKYVWNMQTPQVFEQKLITGAYGEMCRAMKKNPYLFVTDDASVVELFSDTKVALVEGDYTNIKVTTPEDMAFAQAVVREWKTV